MKQAKQAEPPSWFRPGIYGRSKSTGQLGGSGSEGSLRRTVC